MRDIKMEVVVVVGEREGINGGRWGRMDMGINIKDVGMIVGEEV